MGQARRLLGIDAIEQAATLLRESLTIQCEIRAPEAARTEELLRAIAARESDLPS